MVTAIIIVLVVALVTDKKIDWTGALRDRIHRNDKK